MRDIEIWPKGDIDIGAGVIDGHRMVMVRFVDGTTGQAVAIGLDAASFVALADHMRMTADAVLDDSLFQRPTTD